MANDAALVLVDALLSLDVLLLLVDEGLRNIMPSSRMPSS